MENKNQLIRKVTGKSLKGFISRENDELEEKNEQPICEVNDLDELPTLFTLTLNAPYHITSWSYYL